MLVIRNTVSRGLPVVALLAAVTAAAADDSQVRLNSIGFLPEAKKQASIAAECDQFAVMRASDGATAFEGRVSGPLTNNDTGEKLPTALAEDSVTLRHGCHDDGRGGSQSYDGGPVLPT